MADAASGGGDTARPRVLIVAENTSALLGGEAILPLQYFRLFHARGWDMQLITHERNRETLAESFPELVARTRFSPDTWVHKWIWRVGRVFPGSLRDHLFGNLMGMVTGFQQRKMARELVAQGKIDLVHQPIPVSPTAPSLMHGFGVPVIVGPMNGGMNYPPGYEYYESRVSTAFLRIGRVMSGVINGMIPGKPRADLLIVANGRTRRALPIRHANVIELVENGVDLDLWTRERAALEPRAGLRLVFMGRLIRLKGVDFLFQALRFLRDERPDLDITLDILGDGELRTELECLSGKLGLEERVTFHGYQRQSDCAQFLVGADALVLPSLRECGGAVVLEAMATGLPTIVSDWGGPADYVDERSGILVPPAPRESFPERLAQAIVRLAENPELRREMGLAGRKKVEEQFDWSKKIDQMAELYMKATANPRG